MNHCRYCGSLELDIEEDTCKEYCRTCGHYTGVVDESMEEYTTLMGDY